MKRKVSGKSRSGKRASAASGKRAAQPLARGSVTRARSAVKAQGASQPRAASTRTKPARVIGSEPSGAPLDPRIAAVIALALHDEAQAAARAQELARPVSGWTALARARGVRRR